MRGKAIAKLTMGHRAAREHQKPRDFLIQTMRWPKPHSELGLQKKPNAWPRILHAEAARHRQKASRFGDHNDVRIVKNDV